MRLPGQERPGYTQKKGDTTAAVAAAVTVEMVDRPRKNARPMLTMQEVAAAADMAGMAVTQSAAAAVAAADMVGMAEPAPGLAPDLLAAAAEGMALPIMGLAVMGAAKGTMAWLLLNTTR